MYSSSFLITGNKFCGEFQKTVHKASTIHCPTGGFVWKLYSEKPCHCCWACALMATSLKRVKVEGKDWFPQIKLRIDSLQMVKFLCKNHSIGLAEYPSQPYTHTKEITYGLTYHQLSSLFTLSLYDNKGQSTQERHRIKAASSPESLLPC